MSFVQRFDSALRWNLHFHVLWLDGVYSHELGRGKVDCCEHAQLPSRGLTASSVINEFGAEAPE